MKCFFYFVFIAFFFIKLETYAQQIDSTIVLHKISAKKESFLHHKIPKGMEQNSITHITQDSIGNMWFATKNGVVKYNGQQHFIYKNNPNDKKSIGGNFVERVFCANDGSIWIGTEPAKLSKYNPLTDDFTIIQGISGKRIKDIKQDKKGWLWITTDKNLYSYQPIRKKLTKFNYKDVELDRLLITKEQFFYITTNKDFILEYYPDKNTFKEIKLIDKKTFKKSRSTASYSAYHLFQDHLGIIWISTHYGFVLTYHPKTKKIKKFIFEKHWKIGDRLTTMFILEDKHNNIWIGTWFEGMYKILPNRKEVLKFYPSKENPNSLLNNIVHSGFQDKAGYLWFGHEFSGIDILKKEDKFNIIAGNKNNLPNVEFLTITTDNNGTIWLGTAGHGLFYATKNHPSLFTKSNHIIQNITYNWVMALLYDSKGFLWIGTNNGLYKHHISTQKTTHYLHIKDDYNSLISNTITALSEGKDNTIWIGSFNGLTKLNPEKEKFYRFVNEADNPNSLSNNYIRALLVDSKNTLWAGTFNGLNRFNNKTGNFVRYYQNDEPRTIGGNRINSLFEKNNFIWIGAYEGGLTAYNKTTKQFKTYLLEDGLPDNNVISILDDNQNNLWISTTNDISKFNLTTKQFTTYNKTDGLKSKLYIENVGLQDLEFTANVKHKDKNGNLYFGGVSGLTIFNPNNLPINTFKPPTIIQKFKVNGKLINTKNKTTLTFKPNKNHLEIDLAVLNFIQPNKNKIAYFLKGIDSVWNYKNGNHHIEYSNIPKGTYEFFYKGANNDGVWNDKVKAIKIIFEPYFYETSFFYGLLFLFIVALPLAFVWYKMYLKKQYAKQKKALRYSHSSLKKEVANKINTHLVSYLNKEKPYLEADLSLQKLANLIHTKSHYLSQVINQYHQCSFHEFINKYRIKEAKKLLKETVLKIESIAYDSGFNSTSTFNAFFKKETGMTPSKFRKSQK